MSKLSFEKRKWILLCAAAAVSFDRAARAASYTYVGPNGGSFITVQGTPWSPAGYPTSGDDVFVGAAEPAFTSMTVNMNYAAPFYPSGGFDSLTLDPNTYSTIEVDQEPSSTGTSSLETTTLNLDANSKYVQGGAGQTANTITTMNISAGGEYDLTSAQATLTATYINNSGVFSETSGSLNVTSGNNLNISGGSVTVTNQNAIDLINGWTQTGGTITIYPKAVIFAYNYDVTGLTINSNSGSSQFISEGTILLADQIDVSTAQVMVQGDTDVMGNVSINQSADWTTTGDFHVGFNNNTDDYGLFGQVTQSDTSTLSISGNLYLGLQSGTSSVSTFTLAGGVLSATDEYIGDKGHNSSPGTGKFSQSGGSNTTSSLFIGTAGAGEYDLSATGTLTATNATVGSGSYAGTLTISGGLFNVTSTLTLTNSSGTTLNLSGGTADVGTLLTNGNPSLLDWTGGTLHITNQSIDFTSASDSNAPFGNSLTLQAGRALIVNNFENFEGFASGIEQHGGSNAASVIYVQNQGSGGNAEYDLYNGAVTASAEYIGYAFGISTSGGTFVQFNGINNSQQLSIGSNALGVYDIEAGTLQTGTLSIGSQGRLYPGGGTIISTATSNAGTLEQTGGTMNLGAVTGSGSITIDPSGTTIAVAGVNSIVQSSLALSGLSSLVIQTNSTAITNQLNSLSIAANATLDITNNNLYVNYGTNADPIVSIAAWIKSGYAAGAWTGNGIISSNAAANSKSYGIGYADFADAGNPAGLSSGQIEIMYTLLGDANLDGKVNGTDFLLMAANFNQSGKNWDQGDFNYDGKVNGTDFLLMADNFNQFASQADIAAFDDFAAANGISLASVPEPSCALIGGAAGLALLRRRKTNRPI